MIERRSHLCPLDHDVLVVSAWLHSCAALTTTRPESRRVSVQRTGVQLNDFSQQLMGLVRIVLVEHC